MITLKPTAKPNTDEIVKVSVNDTNAGHLGVKLIAGNNITLETLNAGADETFQISALGASPYSGAEQITYDALQAKIAASELDIGKYYQIQDTQTKNQAGFDLNYTAPIEKLTVLAIAINAVSLQAYSENFPDDLIYYDIDVNGITGSVSGGWEEGEDYEDSVQTANWTTSTFDFNREPIVDDNFFVYNEHEEGEAEFEGDGLGTDFTITDLGTGWWRFTDLTGDADFANEDFNYGELEFNAVILVQKGDIIYRKDVIKNIEAGFDFRGVKYYRAKLDTTTIPDWNSSTTYPQKSAVKYGGHTYISLYENTNQAVSTKYWVRVFSELDKAWLFYNPSFYLNGVNYQTEATLKLVPVFADWDGTDFVYNDDVVHDVSMFGDNNVFMKDVGESYTYFRNVIINREANNNTFAGSCEYINLTAYSESNIFNWGSSIRRVSISDIIRNNVVNSSISDLEVGYMASVNVGSLTSSVIRYIRSSILRSVSKTTIGYNNYDMFLSMQNGKIGNNNHHFFLYSSYYDTFGNSNSYIEGLTNNFSNNAFGDLNRYLRFSSTCIMNTFRTNNGRTGVWLVFAGAVRGFVIGNDNFYLGQSSFGSTVQNVIMGSSNSRLTIGYCVNCVFGTNVRSVSCGTASKVEFRDNVAYVDMVGNVQNCTFAFGVTHHSSTTSGTFRDNKIETSNVNYGAAATHAFASYPCTIYERPDGTKRLSFVGNSDTLEVYDPAA